LNDPISIFFRSERRIPQGSQKGLGVSRSAILWVYSTICPAENQVERERTGSLAAPDAHPVIVSLALDSGK
jgi:hypothetical protein